MSEHNLPCPNCHQSIAVTKWSSVATCRNCGAVVEDIPPEFFSSEEEPGESESRAEDRQSGYEREEVTVATSHAHDRPPQYHPPGAYPPPQGYGGPAPYGNPQHPPGYGGGPHPGYGGPQYPPGAPTYRGYPISQGYYWPTPPTRYGGPPPWAYGRYPSAHEMAKAKFEDRGFAFVIDMVVLVFLLVMPLSFLFANSILVGDSFGESILDSSASTLAIALLFYTLFVGYFAVMEGVWGQTLGKMAIGIIVVKDSDFGEIGIWESFLRNVVRYGYFIPLCLGLLFFVIEVIMTLDGGQRIGDRLAKTKVMNKDRLEYLRQQMDNNQGP